MFNIFNKNKYKSNSKTEIFSNDPFICFQDLKGASFEIKEQDNYIILTINSETCRFNREQFKVLVELFNRISQGQSVKGLAQNLEARKDGE